MVSTDAIKKEKFLLIALVVGIVSFFIEHSVMQAGQIASLVMTGVLVFIIVLCSLRVAHHAEVLAEKVGEPYGTMILTLAAVLVEVVILAIMITNGDSPTLARDTIYSAVMLDMNGIMGLAALLGGLKHGEQKFNDDSGKSYLAMIATAIGVSMIIPEFIEVSKWQYYSVFTIIVMILLYGLFLRQQTGTHSYFFNYTYADKGENHHEANAGSTAGSITTLIAGILLIGFLAEIMAKTMDVGIQGTGIPLMFSALLVAGISASPEIMTALRAALANRMQPVVNIALGATLSTVILTIPVIELIALFTGQQIVMALTPVQTAMVVLTLLVSMINSHDGESNSIEGMTHFVLFAAFIMLAFIA